MKQFLKTLGVVVAVVLVLGIATLAWMYASFCGGHPHGMC